jgi:hypothetical protein
LLRDLHSIEGVKAERQAVERLLGHLKQLWDPKRVPHYSLWLESNSYGIGFLRQAEEYYLKSLTNSRHVKTERTELELQLLLGRIQIQLESLPKARESLSLAKSKVSSTEKQLNGFKFSDEIQASEALLKEAQQSLEQEKAELRRMKLSLEKTTRIFDASWEKWEESELERARLLIATQANREASHLIRLLEGHGIHSSIIDRAIPKDQKKGLLSKFF